MDINELIEALKDEKVQAAVSAIIKSHKADAPKPEEAKAEDDATAEMEKDADVKPEDKKPEDEQKPALMRRFAPIIRAIARRTNALAVSEAALFAKLDLKIKASETALLGRSGFSSSTGNGNEDVYETTLAKFKAIEPNQSKAEMAMFRKHPELFQVHNERMQKRIANIGKVA